VTKSGWLLQIPASRWGALCDLRTFLQLVFTHWPWKVNSCKLSSWKINKNSPRGGCGSDQVALEHIYPGHPNPLWKPLRNCEKLHYLATGENNNKGRESLAYQRFAYRKFPHGNPLVNPLSFCHICLPVNLLPHHSIAWLIAKSPRKFCPF